MVMNQRLILAGLLLCLLFIIGLRFGQDIEDKIVFMDVGQGDAILLQSGTQQVLIDGGPDGRVVTRLAEELPWFDRTIDVVIATHPDKDHIAGLVQVLERYKVGLVVLPQISHTSQLQAAWLEQLQAVLDKQGTQYRFASRGQVLTLPNLRLHILHPVLGEAYGKMTNNASVSVLGEYYGLSFLLTGDAEAPTEKYLVDRFGPLLDVDILKAGHHGSKTSSEQRFLDTVRPAAVIISAGLNNQYGHPHPDVMARLSVYHVWRTDEQGSVTFAYHDPSWFVSTARR